MIINEAMLNILNKFYDLNFTRNKFKFTRSLENGSIRTIT